MSQNFDILLGALEVSYLPTALTTHGIIALHLTTILFPYRQLYITSGIYPYKN